MKYDDKTKIASFIYPLKLKQLLMRLILMMYLNQSIVLLHQTDKEFLSC